MIFQIDNSYNFFNFMNTGQYIAVIGGLDRSSWLLSNVEVVRISDEGVVSPSNCKLPELQVQDAAVSNNMICGGIYGIYTYIYPNTTNQCNELNPESLKWEERSQMNIKRYHHAMVTATNKTRYVCGGLDESYRQLKSCEKYDGEWSYIKDLPTSQYGHCMVRIEDFIYSIGGINGSVSD